MTITRDFNPFMHNVVMLKYVWPFYNIMRERVERFHCFNFQISFLKKIPAFLVESTVIENVAFPYKTDLQKPMLQKVNAIRSTK